MNIKEVASTLERFAPLALQEDYDNAGLQIGLTAAEVSGVLLCLDVTEEVLQEALARGCNMVVAHHPLLFRGLKRIGDGTQVERCARLAVQHDVAVYAAHTNLDNADGGVNHEMARRLGLTVEGFLAPFSDGRAGGSGLLGTLAEPMAPIDFLRRVKETFGVAALHHNALLSRPVRRVALCGGAGDFLLPDALRAGADAFLTGEMHYHQYFGQEDRIQIAVLGHYESEQFTVHLLAERLAEACPGLRIEQTRLNTNPILTMI